MKNNALLLIVVVVLILGGGYLFFKNQKLNQSPTQSGQPAAIAPQTSNSVKEISMTAKKFAFDPSEIRVKQGETVRLKIKSLDVIHGFALPDFNVDQQLEPGKEVTVEFVADKKGTFIFMCSVLCGSGHSDMKGTLVVE